MLKKFFILFFLFFTLISGAFAATDNSDILAVNILYIINGYIDYPKWSRPIFASVLFSQRDAQEHELSRFHIASYDCIDKYDNKGYDRYNDFILEYGDVRDVILRDLDNDAQIIARYKFSNNVIYHYDNNPDPKKGILGYFGFHEKGPGHLISTSKIFDDGSIIRYDTAGNKIASLKMTNKKNIKEYDAKGNYIGYYRLFSFEEAFPYQAKKASLPSAKTSNNDFSGAIVPVTIILANAGELQDSEWTQKLKNIDYINCYGSQNQLTGEFSTFGNDFYQYDKHYALVARYSDFGNDVYHYDANNTLIGHFSSFGDDIYQYDQNNAFIGRFTFFGNKLYHYDKDDRKIGSYSIFGSSILQYDKYGKNIAEYSFF